MGHMGHMGQKYSNIAVCTDNRADIKPFVLWLYICIAVQQRDLCQYADKDYRIIRTASF